MVHIYIYIYIHTYICYSIIEEYNVWVLTIEASIITIRVYHEHNMTIVINILLLLEY